MNGKMQIVALMIGVISAIGFGTARAAGEGMNLGFGISSNADARDVGLPIYPGARVHKDGGGGNDSAKIWAGFKSFGMTFATIRLDSNDLPSHIVSFYVDALRHYGPVLDCSPGKAHSQNVDRNPGVLSCDDSQPKLGSYFFKAGEKSDFHAVAIEPGAGKTEIVLIAVQRRGIR